MRIALVTSGFLPALDGVTVAVNSRARWLGAQGHEVEVYCPDYSALADLYPSWADCRGDIATGVRVVPLASGPLMDVPYERNITCAGLDELDAHLDRFRPDLVHVDEPERICMTTWHRRPALAWARHHGVPCIAHHHTNFIDYTEDMGFPRPLVGPIMFFGRYFLRWVYNAYDLTLVPGQTTCAKLQGWGVKNARWACLNGFDRRSFSPDLRAPAWFERQHGLDGVDGKVVIAIVGRLSADKGWGFFLDALPALAESVDLDRVAWVVVGAGDMEERICAATSALPHFHLLGRVPHAEVPAILANCDLFLSSSTKENFALTVIEAMGSGLPVLAPRAGGMIDAVVHEQTGLLFEPDDVWDFARKLALLTGDAQLRQSMARAGMARVEALDWETTLQTWLDIVGAQLQSAEHTAEAALAGA